MMLVSILSIASAATLVVDGTTYTSISDAVADAASGDTISVAAGTWYDCVDTAGKSLSIVGSSGSVLTILDAAGVCDEALSVRSGEASVSVQGLTVRNRGKRAIGIDATAVSLVDLIIDNAGGTGLVDAAAIRLDGGRLDVTTLALDGVSASACDGILLAEGTSATLTDLSANNSGDVICVESLAELELVNAAVRDSGVVLTLGAGAEVSSSGSSFLRNTRWALVGEGAAYSSSQDSFVNTPNADRTAFGGMINADEDAVVDIDGGLLQGTSGRYGGAIYASLATLSVRNTTIELCEADYGGAIYATNRPLTLENNVFSGNAADQGGAVYTVYADLTDTGSTYDSNTASDEGGALFLRGDATLINSVFTQNTARFNGGAIRCDDNIAGTSTLTVQGGRFESNVASSGDGGALETSHSFTLQDVEFIRNSADDGGAVYAFGDGAQVVVISGSSFEQNSGTHRAGALFLSHIDGVQIDDSTFSQNGAPEGGALHLNHAAASVSGATFSENVVSDSGGAVLTTSADGLWLYDSWFVSNSAGSGEGGALRTSVPVTIEGGLFCDNTASQGGAVYAQAYDFTLEQTLLLDNAADSGGALYFVGGSLALTNNTFAGNEAPEGAVANFYTNDGALLNNVFAYSGRGEAVYGRDTYSGDNLTATYNDWYGNTVADQDGSLSFPLTGFGNITSDPQFVAYSNDGDCWNDSLLPQSGSPLIDAGSPSLLDEDGSRSDIGATGGAGSPWVDADGDQWLSGFDCDDADNTSSPGQTEACDGRDNDCDGSVDEEASDAGAWYTDADGDGHGDPVSLVLSCEAPDGAVSLGDDCDDSNPQIVLPEEEIPYDGVDQDCNGSDLVDVDGDGYDAAQAGGEDCDDDAANVHPGAPDAPYDGLDANCDERSDFDADEDGFDAADYGGEDCDDGSAVIHPGAADSPGDGIDADCDGSDGASADDSSPLDDTGLGGGDKGCGGCAGAPTGATAGLALLGLALIRRRS